MDTKAVTKEYLRQEFVAFGIKGLLKITGLTEKITVVLSDCYNRFTVEED